MPRPFARELLAATLSTIFVRKVLERKLGKLDDIPKIIIDPHLKYPGTLDGQTIKLLPTHTRNIHTIAEELGHYYRRVLAPKERAESVTDEFFGFLSTRLAYDALTQKEREERQMTEPKLFHNRREILLRSKEMRQESAELDRAFQEADIDVVEEKMDAFFRKYGHTPDQTMRSKLVHYRGYRYASRVNISRIQNIRALFCMPNWEVRMRYFREAPNYSHPITAIRRQIPRPRRLRSKFRKPNRH